MNNLSAAQAISPAIEITKHFLFKPFRWKTFLKLTLVAMLTEGGLSSCNFNSSTPSGSSGGGKVPFTMPHWPAMHLHWPALPILLAVVVGILVLLVPLAIFISYLLIRLRFSFFDCVLRRQHLIAPAWRRYHHQAMRYLGLSVLVGAVAWIILGITGYFLYEHFKPLVQSILHGGQPSFSEFLPVIATVAPVFMLLMLGAALIDTAMGNFVLPRMALDDASIPDALEDVWIDVKAEPGQFALFVLLKFLLALVGSILGMIALFIPMVFIVGIGAVVVILLKSVSIGLAVGLGLPAGLLVLALLVMATIGVSGTIGTFRRSYAIAFYAGRYEAMADILQPTQVQTPPMPWPSQNPGIV